MIPTVKTAPNMSISIYFKIVFPTFASMIVQTLPAIKTYQFMPVSTLAYRGVIPPRTNPANVSCAKLKRNPLLLSIVKLQSAKKMGERFLPTLLTLNLIL